MNKRLISIALLIAITFIGASALSGTRDGVIDARKALLGVWAINFIAPVSPKGNDFGQPHRHKLEFRDDDGQRTVVAREILELRVPGAWRTSGDQFSATFEFTCPEGVTCGTITLRGRIDSDTRMSGRLAIIWDSPDNTTSSGYDTVIGTFTGEKCSGLIRAHDTGGCETP